MKKYEVDKLTTEMSVIDLRNASKRNPYQDVEPTVLGSFDTLEEAKAFFDKQYLSAPHYEPCHQLWLVERIELVENVLNDEGELDYANCLNSKQNLQCGYIGEREQ